MKKVILAVIAVVCINFNLAAQDIEQDITYYKLLNKLWTMSSGFDKVAFHLENQSVELEKIRTTELKALTELRSEVANDFALLKTKNYDEAAYLKLENMIAAIDDSLKDLKGEQWTSDTMWQFGYNVVKMNLGDMGKQKPDIKHLSQN